MEEIMDSYLIYLFVIVIGALMFMFMEPSKGKVKVDLTTKTQSQENGFEAVLFYDRLENKENLLNDLEFYNNFGLLGFDQSEKDQFSFLVSYHDIDLSSYPNLNKKLNS
jgi:hypothetical protein